jgi:hypothetical protein
MHQTPAIVLIVALSASGALAACGGITPHPLPPPQLQRLVELEQTPAASGDQVYEGRVYALDGRPSPLFSYERRVQSAGSSVTSTHITHDPTGAVVVMQSAVHAPTYELQRADMIHRQTGTTASVVVMGHEAVYTLNDGTHATSTRERPQAPLVAGPTMFGYILAHWAELTRGETLPIRFAVLERGESIGFALEQVEAPEGRTIIRMKPTSLLVRLAVAPTYFQFDTASRRILEYTGRVPPLEQIDDRLETLDARVAYSFVAPAFR